MFPLSLLVPDRHSPRVKASRLTTGLTQVHRTHPLLSDLAGGCVLAQVASETQGRNHNHNQIEIKKTQKRNQRNTLVI
jgi:hypothetical protein